MTKQTAAAASKSSTASSSNHSRSRIIGRRWSRLKSTAQKIFGIDRIRPGQDEVLRALIDGADVLAIMPAGYGKSLCYQLPTMSVPGATVIVSPLIALMKDQSDKLRAIGLNASQINSAIPPRRRARNLDAIEDRKVDFVFTTPKQLSEAEFVATLAQRVRYGNRQARYPLRNPL